MVTFSKPSRLTPEDVERAGKRDGKRYELIDGALREKAVGMRNAFIAGLISARLNEAFYPSFGCAIAGAMIYCFDRPDHGRKPEVTFIRLDRLPGKKLPQGDLMVAPDLVAEILSDEIAAIEVQNRLDEYLAAGVRLVWIVNPDRRTIRIYRADGTTRLFQGADVMENEPLLPGFRLVTAEVFPDEGTAMIEKGTALPA
ncbi:MAG TPA: Uma2 family endonuclease [Tepidisphaeraceae bacterium]|nr:Uma2 family endonuclease [Tepidisphaeraceae bacterium]